MPYIDDWPDECGNDVQRVFHPVLLYRPSAAGIVPDGGVVAVGSFPYHPASADDSADFGGRETHCRPERDSAGGTGGASGNYSMTKFGIGQGVPRWEDPRLLRGGGRYSDDLNRPGQAYGYVLRSPHAHAEIRSIDTAAARAVPGVLAVYTHDDVEAAGLGSIPCAVPRNKADGSPMFTPPNLPLRKGRVRLVGDYVAFVVAETHDRGARRCRGDRGRLRAATLGHRDRGRARRGSTSGLAGGAGQCLLRLRTGR